MSVGAVEPLRTSTDNSILAFAVLLAPSTLYYLHVPVAGSPEALVAGPVTVYQALLAGARYLLWTPFPLSTLWRSWIANVVCSGCLVVCAVAVAPGGK